MLRKKRIERKRDLEQMERRIERKRVRMKERVSKLERKI